MLAIYHSADIPPFLDARARDLLAEGRETFARFELGERKLLSWAGGSLLFPWKGDRILGTLVVWLNALGHGVAREGVALVFADADPDRVREQCAKLAAEPPPDPVELGAAVINKKTEKFHPWLSDGLLTLDFASRALDVEGAWEAVQAATQGGRPGWEGDQAEGRPGREGGPGVQAVTVAGWQEPSGAWSSDHALFCRSSEEAGMTGAGPAPTGVRVQLTAVGLDLTPVGHAGRAVAGGREGLVECCRTHPFY